MHSRRTYPTHYSHDPAAGIIIETHVAFRVTSHRQAYPSLCAASLFHQKSVADIVFRVDERGNGCGMVSEVCRRSVKRRRIASISIEDRDGYLGKDASVNLDLAGHWCKSRNTCHAWEVRLHVCSIDAGCLDYLCLMNHVDFLLPHTFFVCP